MFLTSDFAMVRFDLDASGWSVHGRRCRTACLLDAGTDDVTAGAGADGVSTDAGAGDVTAGAGADGVSN